MTEEKGFMRHYSLRFSLLPSADFEERTEKLIDFCKKARIDDVMFFIAAEEVNTGHITLEEAKRYAEVISRAKKILKENGITVSLNPWRTLSHYDGGRKLKSGQNFRLMTDSNGTVAESVVCPLCTEWRDYFAGLLSFFAEKLEPEIIWFEDDMRLNNHDPVWNGCFCEEHMKRFNAALGTDYDRETFVKLIPCDEKVRKAYLDLCGETIRETIEYIVRKVPSAKAFGLMTGDAGQREGRRYKEIFRAMTDGGRHPTPFDRICLHSYRQRGMQENAWSINETSMLARAAAGNGVRCVSEMENFPHSMYTKSANYFKYQMLSTAAMGLTGDTFSIFEFNGNGAVNYERYADMLRSVKPYLSGITALGLSPDKALGVRVIYGENSAYTLKCRNGGLRELYPYDGWLYAYLTQLGIACAYSDNIDVSGQIVAMSGQTVRNYTPFQLERLFKNNYVILTGDNVEALFDMGLSSLINAESFSVMPELDGIHAMEELNSDDRILGIKRMRATSQFFCGSYYNIRYTDGKRKVFTRMLGSDEKTVGDGIVQTGNVLIIPYMNTRSDQKVPISLICPLREYVIKRALSESGFAPDSLYFAREENVCVYAFDGGDRIYMVCMNFVDDDYPVLHLDLPYSFEKITVFAPDGQGEREASYSSRNGEYTIDNLLKAQESYLLTGYMKKTITGIFSPLRTK